MARRLTGKLLINPPILRQKAIKLAIRSNHPTLRKIRIQAQTPHSAEQTSNGDFLLTIGL